MRKCKACGLEKPIENFRERLYDGKYRCRIWQCEGCERDAKTEWERKNPEKVAAQKARYQAKHRDELRIRDRRRYLNPARREYCIASANVRFSTPDGRAQKTLIGRRWREENPEKYRAQTALGNAVRDGKILKGPCASCGDSGRVVGHHHDYFRPLDVVWLCPACHGIEHRTLRWGEEVVNVLR